MGFPRLPDLSDAFAGIEQRTRQGKRGNHLTSTFVPTPEPGRDGVADQWHQGYRNQWFWSEVDHDHHDVH